MKGWKALSSELIPQSIFIVSKNKILKNDSSEI